MSGSSESKKPHNASPIVITGGDPAGVGPELILQLCPRMLASGVPVTYFFTGSSQSLESFVAKTEDTVPELRVRVAREASASTAPQPGTLNVIPVSRAALGGKEPPEPGRPGPDGGRSAFEALRMACEYVRAEGGSLLTAPLSKAMVAASVPGFAGHTDFLADFFKRDVLMLLHGDLVSVIPLTIHVPLRDVPGRLREALDRPATFKVLSSLLEWPEFQKTRWALCGMNPHAGEEGHLGTEEIDFMNEAAARFRAGGLPLEGPVAADSAFMPEDRKYRLVLSAYHDQGLGPFKAIEGRGGINVTVGLPFFRASPDHGTAFEIAGKGIADPHSMLRAWDFLIGRERKVGHAES